MLNCSVQTLQRIKPKVRQTQQSSKRRMPSRLRKHQHVDWVRPAATSQQLRRRRRRMQVLRLLRGKANSKLQKSNKQKLRLQIDARSPMQMPRRKRSRRLELNWSRRRKLFQIGRQLKSKQLRDSEE